MEYEFSRTFGCEPQVQLSMGHEALSRFINDELSHNTAIESLFQQLALGPYSEQKPLRLEGREQWLLITHDEVLVQDNVLLDEFVYDDPDLTLYDAESEACCGLTDFEHLLHQWHQFINSR
ncbi:MAG: YacL family protein [Ferrimonas sp.]